MSGPDETQFTVPSAISDGKPKRRANSKIDLSDAAGLRPPSLLTLPSYLAGNVGRIGHRVLLRVVEEHGLRLPDYAVITALSDFGPLAQHEISDRLDFERAHVVRFVDRLEKHGFVRRDRSQSDRRQVVVSLTEEGRAAQAELAEAAAKSEAEFLSMLDAGERQQLLELLHRVLIADDAERLALTQKGSAGTAN